MIKHYRGVKQDCHSQGTLHFLGMVNTGPMIAYRKKITVETKLANNSRLTLKSHVHAGLASFVR